MGVLEHEGVGPELPQVGSQGLEHCVRKRHDANARLRLRWGEERLASPNVDQLPIDEDGSLVEVDAVGGEAEELTLAQAAPAATRMRARCRGGMCSRIAFSCAEPIGWTLPLDTLGISCRCRGWR